MLLMHQTDSVPYRRVYIFSSAMLINFKFSATLIGFFCERFLFGSAFCPYLCYLSGTVISVTLSGGYEDVGYVKESVGLSWQNGKCPTAPEFYRDQASGMSHYIYCPVHLCICTWPAQPLRGMTDSQPWLTRMLSAVSCQVPTYSVQWPSKQQTLDTIRRWNSSKKSECARPALPLTPERPTACSINCSWHYRAGMQFVFNTRSQSASHCNPLFFLYFLMC